MPHIHFIAQSGREHFCAYENGDTILSVAHKFKLDLEGACGGAMACSTCHVKVDGAWSDKLPRPSQEECDMLDLAPKVTKASRLGCQIVLTENLDGIVVRLPCL